MRRKINNYEIEILKKTVGKSRTANFANIIFSIPIIYLLFIIFDANNIINLPFKDSVEYNYYFKIYICVGVILNILYFYLFNNNILRAEAISINMTEVIKTKKNCFVVFNEDLGKGNRQYKIKLLDRFKDDIDKTQKGIVYVIRSKPIAVGLSIDEEFERCTS